MLQQPAIAEDFHTATKLSIQNAAMHLQLSFIITQPGNTNSVFNVVQFESLRSPDFGFQNPNVADTPYGVAA